jgi:hypothetical protein
MKKFKTLALIIFVIAFMSVARADTTAFLATAVSVNATVTKVIVTDFPDHKIPLGGKETATFTFEFTRAAGSASTVDFRIQGSKDDGATWTTFYTFQIPTNTVIVTGTTVRVLYDVNLPAGYTHVRLYSIYNSDATNNLTEVNAYMSFKVDE